MEDGRLPNSPLLDDVRRGWQPLLSLTCARQNSYNPGIGATVGGRAITMNSLNSIRLLGYSPAPFNRDYAVAYALGFVDFCLYGVASILKGGNEMIPENRIPTHPGVVLKEEFLILLGLTQVALAKHLGVPTQRINELIRGKRGVTPETAWLLAGAFRTTPQFWLNLQTNYDLAINRPKQEIRPVAQAA